VQVGELFLEHSQHDCKDRNTFVEEMSLLVLEARRAQIRLDRIDISDLLSRVYNVLHRLARKDRLSYSNCTLDLIFFVP
jgi:hypothetical protein